MGEAKRRKQALGDRFGKTPPVLMDGSVQLEKNTKDFADAYFEQLQRCPNELLARYLQSPEANLNETHSVQNDKAYQELKNWLTSYFKPFRQQDREKLSLGFLLPLYANLYLNGNKREGSEEEKTRHFIMDLTMCLFSFNCLKSFLSKPNQERYGGILHKIYSDMKTEIKADRRLHPEDNTQELESLTKLFHPILDTKAALV